MSKSYVKITFEVDDGITASQKSLTWYSDRDGNEMPEFSKVLAELLWDDERDKLSQAIINAEKKVE